MKINKQQYKVCSLRHVAVDNVSIFSLLYCNIAFVEGINQ